MKVIFGIGNPGTEYEFTRHNIGFQVIDKLTTQQNVALKLQKNWLFGKINDSLIIKPLSYVNNCGIVARKVISEFDISFPDFLVIVDDFALPIGTTRLRVKGSSGGHKGLESIIYQLETEEFPRLRIGIGPKDGDAVDFVLSKFKKSELKIIEDAVIKALLVIDVFVKEGVNRAVEVCNVN